MCEKSSPHLGSPPSSFRPTWSKNGSMKGRLAGLPPPLLINQGLGVSTPDARALKCLLPALVPFSSPDTPGELLGLFLREQAGPFSLSPDLGAQATQASRSRPIVEFVGLLLTWELISFLQPIYKYCSY